jgi:hypothetical protein
VSNLYSFRSVVQGASEVLVQSQGKDVHTELQREERQREEKERERGERGYVYKPKHGVTNLYSLFQGASEVVLQSQGKDVTKFLSIHLKYIAADAEKCKHEAKLVLDSFEKVSAILNDLSEAIIILKKCKSKGKT